MSTESNKNVTHTFSFQLKCLICSKQLRYCCIVGMLCLTGSFLSLAASFWGTDVADLPPAELGWMGNIENINAAFWMYALLYILPILVGSLFCDILCRDLSKCRLYAIISRSSRKNYMISAFCVTWLSSFFFILVLEILSIGVSYLIFPAVNTPDMFQVLHQSNASHAYTYSTFVSTGPFGSIATLSILLYHFVFALYDSAIFASLALCSFGVSWYAKRLRIIVMLLPAACMLLGTTFLPRGYTVTRYLWPTASYWTPWHPVMLIALPLVPALIGVLCLVSHEYLFGGDLL